MKKIVLIFIFLCGITFLTACAKEEVEDDDTNSPAYVNEMFTGYNRDYQKPKQHQPNETTSSDPVAVEK